MKTKIEDLREHLFATLESLRDEEKPMEIGRAKAIAEVAGRIIDSAKVEVDFMKVAKRQVATNFIPLDPRPEPQRLRSAQHQQDPLRQLSPPDGEAIAPLAPKL